MKTQITPPRILVTLTLAIALALPASSASAEMTDTEKDNTAVTATFLTGTGIIIAGLSATNPAGLVALGIGTIIAGFAAAKENKDARDGKIAIPTRSERRATYKAERGRCIAQRKAAGQSGPHARDLCRIQARKNTGFQG